MGESQVPMPVVLAHRKERHEEQDTGNGTERGDGGREDREGGEEFSKKEKGKQVKLVLGTCFHQS